MRICFGIGTNLGDREKNLRTAVELLTERVGELLAWAYRACLTYLENSDNAEPADVDAAESKYEATFNAYVNCHGPHLGLYLARFMT